MKKILVINFSQTGQLDEIINTFLKPFNNHDIDRIHIKVTNPFPFPWNSQDFFNLMPETVLEESTEIDPINFKYEKYDLIILGYQPWFLSPSLPTIALFKNKEFGKLLKGTPIITIIGARNMWINAQERIKHLIHDAGGKLIANIPFVDQTTNLVSVITISHWMFSGKKEKKWNIFPYPGISKKDIASAFLFGEIVINAIRKNDYEDLQEAILKLNKIKIKTNILFIESKAKRIFTLWAKQIKKHKKNSLMRNTLIKLFKYYLFFALFFISPILLTLYTIFIVPFNLTNIDKKKKYFCSVNLK